MGASFRADDVHYVFSRQPAPASLPAGVQFVKESIRAFAERLRREAGKNIWMMGGGEIIGSFLDEDSIDEFIPEQYEVVRTKDRNLILEKILRKVI